MEGGGVDRGKILWNPALQRRWKFDGDVTGNPLPVLFSKSTPQANLPSPPPIGQGWKHESERSISAINISAYGRLEEFHESSEAREAKLSARWNSTGILLDPPFSPDRHGPRTRNIETTKQLEDSPILDAVRDGLNEKFPRVWSHTNKFCSILNGSFFFICYTNMKIFTSYVLIF